MFLPPLLSVFPAFTLTLIDPVMAGSIKETCNVHPHRLLDLGFAGTNLDIFAMRDTKTWRIHAEYVWKDRPIPHNGEREICWSSPATPLPVSICRIVLTARKEPLKQQEVWVPDEALESIRSIQIFGGTAFNKCIEHQAMFEAISSGSVAVGMLSVIGTPRRRNWYTCLYGFPCWVAAFVIIFIIIVFILWLKEIFMGANNRLLGKRRAAALVDRRAFEDALKQRPEVGEGEFEG